MDKTIEKFIKGTQYCKIVKPVSKEELTDIDVNDTEKYRSLNCVKFVPASGAATRMFKDLYTYLETNELNEGTKTFLDNLDSFAFSDKLLSGNSLTNREIIQNLLEDKLGYGELPKALIIMHTYENKVTTPIDEHIIEGEQYLNKDFVKLHFTLSEEHVSRFNDYVDQALEGKDAISITHSFQKKHTDTLAVDEHNEPFMVEDNTPLYRPGGHGALIENLNDIDADIIFIKNIDNVCHQDYLKTTVKAKKKLASTGLSVKVRIDDLIRSLMDDSVDLTRIETFLKETLNISLNTPLTKARALEFLNRPLRVCGVVKNQGEPGGGPFIVDNGSYTDLQICETSEIDLSKEDNKQRLEDSNYFNPVDIVCFVKDYQGNKFNLLNYVNEDRYFISEKSYKSRALKALEHPGLWNGAMHHWNTVFVEVPLITFNPVKTVNDLLRKGHTPRD